MLDQRYEVETLHSVVGKVDPTSLFLYGEHAQAQVIEVRSKIPYFDSMLYIKIFRLKPIYYHIGLIFGWFFELFKYSKVVKLWTLLLITFYFRDRNMKWEELAKLWSMEDFRRPGMSWGCFREVSSLGNHLYWSYWRIIYPDMISSAEVDFSFFYLWLFHFFVGFSAGP